MIVLDVSRIESVAMKLEILQKARRVLTDVVCPRTGVRLEIVRGGDNLVIAGCCHLMEAEARRIIEARIIGPPAGSRGLTSFPGHLIEVR